MDPCNRWDIRQDGDNRWYVSGSETGDDITDDYGRTCYYVTDGDARAALIERLSRVTGTGSRMVFMMTVPSAGHACVMSITDVPYGAGPADIIDFG